MSKGSFWSTVVASIIAYAMVLATSVFVVKPDYVFWIAHAIGVALCVIMFVLIWFYQVKERRNGN